MKPYNTDDMTPEEVSTITEFIDGLKSFNDGLLVNNYFYKKYKNTAVWKKLLDIVFGDKDYEYADNFHINDGIVIDIYGMDKSYLDAM